MLNIIQGQGSDNHEFRFTANRSSLFDADQGHAVVREEG